MNDIYGTKEKQNILLGMMKDIHAFCLEHDIKYSLAYGSMLGAVRHEGFIPWDDDLDIIMDRENYEKFLAVADALSGYKVVPLLWINRIKFADDDSRSLETPTIDIFVFDNAPKGFKRKLKLLLLCLLQGMLHEKPDGSKGSAVMKLCLIISWLFGKLFTYKFKFRLYDRIARIGNRKETDSVGIYNGEFSHIFKLFDKSDFSKAIPHKFEDTELYILDNYDYLLKTLYGDYMTPPPEAERVPKHE